MDFKEANRAILDRKMTMVELAELTLKNIKEQDQKIKSFIFLDEDLLLAQAYNFDIEIASGRFRKNLGLTLSVKDNIYVSGLGIGMGTDLWKIEKSGFDARVISNLKESGALIVGKTKTAEFAIHKPPDTRNPIDYAAAVGTSSTGSAASVSANFVMASIGTQSAASVIKPASYCNVIGFKPSYGMIPRTGILKTADTLDSVGFFSKDYETLDVVFAGSLVSGIDHPFNNIKANMEQNKKKIRIAILLGPEISSERVQFQFMEKVDKLLRNTNFDRIEIDLNRIVEEARTTHRNLYYGNVAYFLAQDLQIDFNKLSPELQEVIEFGNKVTQLELHEARLMQEKFTTLVDDMFEDVDYILTPSTFDVPPDFGKSDQINDSSFFWTLCGNPTISIPGAMSFNGERYVGLQVIAKKYNDYNLIEFAKQLHRIWGE